MAKKFDAQKWLEKAIAKKDNAEKHPQLSWLYGDTERKTTFAADGFRVHGFRQLLGNGFIETKDSYPITKNESEIIKNSMAAFLGYRAYSANVHTSDFLKAVKRAMVFAKDSGNSVKFNFYPEDRALTVYGRSAEVGDCSCTMDAVVTAEKMVIAMNGQFVIDALSGMEDEERVIIQFDGPLSSVLIRTEDFTRFAVINPMSGPDDKAIEVMNPMLPGGTIGGDRLDDQKIAKAKKSKKSAATKRADATVTETVNEDEKGRTVQHDEYRRPLSDFAMVAPRDMSEQRKNREREAIDAGISQAFGYRALPADIHAFTAVDGSFLVGWTIQETYTQDRHIALHITKNGNTVTVQKIDFTTAVDDFGKTHRWGDKAFKPVFETKELTAREAADYIIAQLREKAASFTYHGKVSAKNATSVESIAA